MKDILFIIDKIELKYFEFNKLVTNFWLIKEFLSKGLNVFISTIPMLSLKNGVATSSCYRAFIKDDNIFYESKMEEKVIDSFNLVMFRPDPPVDIDYINATYIFDFVSTKVVNSPKSIRSFNEKLHSLHFKEYMTEEEIYLGTKNYLIKNQFLVIAGQPPRGVDHLPVIEIKDNNSNKGSKFSYKPDLIAFKNDKTIIIECKPLFDYGDYTKLKSILANPTRIQNLYNELKQYHLFEKIQYTKSINKIVREFIFC